MQQCVGSMDNSLAAMKTAMRVLAAVNEKRAPETADLDELRRLAPLLAELPADELACDVIKQALQRRDALRRALRAPG
jgi:hypothetical protein